MPHVDLLELPYFEGISIDSVVSLVDLMEPRCFAADSVIMSESDATTPPLYIATTGRVSICKQRATQPDAPAGERQLAELASPTLFGEVEMFCQVAPVATVRTLTTVNSFVLTRQTFERLFAAQHPGLMLFTFNVARVACHRLAVADAMLATVMTPEDLVTVRQAVFARMGRASGAPRIAGQLGEEGKA